MSGDRIADTVGWKEAGEMDVVRNSMRDCLNDLLFSEKYYLYR